MNEVYGAVLLGGTKIECAWGSGSTINDPTFFSSADPEAVILQIVNYFEQVKNRQTLVAIGVGSFGPVDIEKGEIRSTPKAGWSNKPIKKILSDKLSLPIIFDLDVNTEALGEYTYGAARGSRSFIYLTVGTGIGGGGMIDGKFLHGLSHPEMGHILVPHDSSIDPFSGLCPFHGDCLEGLASGPAMEARWKESPKNWPINHKGWELELDYLSLALVNYTLLFSPEKIIVGGGVTKAPSEVLFYERLQANVLKRLGGYNVPEAIAKNISGYILAPELEHPGLLGCLAMAQASVTQKNSRVIL